MEMVTKTVRLDDPNNEYNGTRGPKKPLNGSTGDDTLTGIKADSGQIHVRGFEGDDQIDLIFEKAAGTTSTFSAWGHQTFHVYAGPGADTINFVDMQDADHVIVGRLDDMNMSQDKIQVNGQDINLLGPMSQLPSDVRVVEFNGQQWLQIGDNAIFALEGARQKPGGVGDEEERHFTLTDDVNQPFPGEARLPADLNTLQEVKFIDQDNFVPIDATSESANWTITSADSYTGTSGDDFIYAEKNSGTPGDTTAKSQWIEGGAGNDYINANSGEDTVFGGDGNDKIAGGLDNDTLEGGAGADRIYGGSEDDRIYGDSGSDLLYGGTGNDSVYSGSGSDKVYLGDGDDYVRVGGGVESFFGGEGNDYISYFDSANGVNVNLQTNVVSGSWASNDVIKDFENASGSETGDDVIYGTTEENRIRTYGGDDTVYAGSGDDEIFGGDGDDRLILGSGSDYVEAGTGNDSVFSGSGADVVDLGAGNDYVRVGGGEESFFGGSGKDYISYYDSANGVTINLDTDEVSRSWAVNDTISNFESASGSKTGDDTIIGTSGANTIKTYGGDDRLEGGGGNDKLEGGGGNDKLYGNGGDDVMKGGSGSDRFDGGAGTDQLYGGTGADTFHFDKNEDNDVIKDFEIGVDVIELDNFSFSSTQDAFNFATQSGSDVVFNFGGGDSLRVEDVTIADLMGDVDIV